MMVENELNIFDFLYEKIGNEYGVAGLMGNLMAESGLKPTNLQSSGNTKLGVTDLEYTNNVDSGKYSKVKFCYDKFGYGLAQWTYRTRKQALYEFAKASEKSIGDLTMQLEFLWKELQSYSSVLDVLKSAKTVREASDAVLEKYEKPADQSESVKLIRENLGCEIYLDCKMRESILAKIKQKYVRINAKSVNVRTGPGKKYKTIGYVYKGEVYPFMEKDVETGWYKIVFPVIFNKQRYGYVTNRYTSIVEDS